MVKAEPTKITGIRIKLRTLSDLDRLAKKRKRSRNYIVNQAIEQIILQNDEND